MRNGGSMSESKILPTILIILPSSVFLLLAHPGAGKAAAEKCNTRPSSSAPQGTHWYYRINSADNRRWDWSRSQLSAAVSRLLAVPVNRFSALLGAQLQDCRTRFGVCVLI